MSDEVAVSADILRLYAPDECGADGYPPAWHDTIKHAVRAWADHRCIRCGHPYSRGTHGNGEWSPCDERCRHDGPFGIIHVAGGVVQAAPTDEELAAARAVIPSAGAVQARWRILTVHHLDGNKGNCRWWNLVALCQRCHLQVQGKVQMARVWPWEHTEWFRPYVAGFYAASYLGEDLTRGEVEGRLEELLALERVA